MAFVNISMLLGGLFVAIPIVIHLTMRRQPKRQAFPALQLLKERRDSNRRRLQIRQWILLALRCGLIILLASALARPSADVLRFSRWALVGVVAFSLIPAAIVLALAIVQRRSRLFLGGSALACAVLSVLLVALLTVALQGGTSPGLGNERAPVAAALIVDTSLRMEYRFENRKRLEEAREMALWLLNQLPRGSQIAVVDSIGRDARFSVDSTAARKAIERLDVSALSEPLAETVQRAIGLLQASDNSRQEAYVISDLTLQSWPASTATRLRQQMADAPELSIYVVDVGVSPARNVSLGDLQLSAETVAHGSELRITTQLKAVGPAGNHSVELFLEVPDEQRPVVVDGETLLPESMRRDQVVAELSDEAARQVEFRLAGLPAGLHQGSVRLQAGDGLPIDDVRYFAVQTRDAWPVLVSAPPDVLPQLFVEAVTPFAFREARFECTVIDQAELSSRGLFDFAAVCLLDPRPLAPAAWEQLASFVSEGGGLAIFLGHNAYPAEQFMTPLAEQLIGAALVRRWRAGDRGLFLAPSRFDHAILAPFRELSTSVPWSNSPVYRHWVLDQIGERTEVLLPYSNNQPALLETGYGQGRVLTLTTPVSDPLAPAGRSPWNELPTSENAWPYLVLVNELVGYLVNDKELRLNYQAGEEVILPNRTGPDRYLLFSPGEESFDVAAHRGTVTVRYTERPGAYRLKGQRDGPVIRGFAVNVPAEATDLQRLEPESLAEFFGEDRYHYARQRDEIMFEVGQSRIGREFYPYLVTVLVIVVGLEHLLANRFYQRTP